MSVAAMDVGSPQHLAMRFCGGRFCGGGAVRATPNNEWIWWIWWMLVGLSDW
jgi:hypothetical protein